MKTPVLAAAVLLVFGVAACGETRGERALTGAGIGAGGGAAAAAIIGGGIGAGALIGAGVGALTGVLTAGDRY